MQKNPHGYRSHHDKSHRGVERSPKMKAEDNHVLAQLGRYRIRIEKMDL